MIAPGRLYSYLQEQGVDFFTGVPDSLLKDFLKYINDHSPADQHVITANEGLSIGLASGYYFNTGRLPLVYLQNSGLGNIINPLTSLADHEMYAVPMLLLIGWRGQPGTKDEPQHSKMGRITVQLLNTLELPCYPLTGDENDAFTVIKDAIDDAKDNSRPVALLVPEGIFEKNIGTPELQDKYELERETVIRHIIGSLNGEEIVVCTTGKSGREFYEQNNLVDGKIKRYLLSAGAMGHANHIALGIGLHSTKRTVMLDGDGAVLMHLGSLPTIARHAGDNFLHIVINNGSHESVGGQPTGAFEADLCAIAKGSGYPVTILIDNKASFDRWLKDGLSQRGLQFVEIRTNRRSRIDLGRPAGLPSEWKSDFMNANNAGKSE